MMNDFQRKWVEDNYDLIESIAACYNEPEEQELAWELAAEYMCVMVNNDSSCVFLNNDAGLMKCMLKPLVDAGVEKHKWTRYKEVDMPSIEMERIVDAYNGVGLVNPISPDELINVLKRYENGGLI